MDIPKFYDGNCVLITGTTGFIGKVLLEKILYSCSGVKNIYILLRRHSQRTRKVSLGNRFNDLIESRAFDRIRKEKPNDLKKIIPIWSELTEPGLGISESDREMLIKNTSIVFHSAASTNFLEPLKQSLMINVIATKSLLDLYKEFETKLAFVHFSTAFFNPALDIVKETVYPFSVSPDFLIESCKHYSTDELESLLPTISEGRKNTYSLTKSVAEVFLNDHSDGLPVSIVRPSIVSHSLADPLPIARGFVHLVPTKADGHFDIIPVDMVCNLAISVAASLQHNSKQDNKKEIPVYNCVSDGESRLKFKSLYDEFIKYATENPSTLAVCYPHLSFTTNFFKWKFGEIFHHYLPALCLDIVRKITGKEMKFMRLYRKYFRFMEIGKQFVAKECHFESKMSQKLLHDMSSEDQKTFNFNIAKMSWNEYLLIWFRGMREFFFPNEEINLEKGKRKLKILIWRYRMYNTFLFINLTALIMFPLFKFIF